MSSAWTRPLLLVLLCNGCTPVDPPPPVGKEGEGEGEGEGEAGEGEGEGGEGEGEGEDVDGLLFFAADVLHQIDIVVAPGDLEQLDSDLTVRVPCTFTYDGETVVDAGCRKKGQSTLRPLAEKPSFSIKLDEIVDGADIDGVQKFALNNSVMDTTFLSEPLSYLLYERAGIPTPRTAHAVVRFNGETKGIYVVVEGVNKRFLRGHYGDGDGNLYEGPWDFPLGADAADLKDEDEGRSRDDLAALTDVVMNATDDALADALAPLLDVDELIDSVAVDMSFCLWDGYAMAAWNFYLYDVPGRGFVMLPHGADWPYWISDVDPYDIDLRPWGEEYPSGFLANRVVTVPALRERYSAALVRVRDEAFDVTAFAARIDGVETVLHTADTGDAVVAGEVAAFDDSVQSARDFVVDRRAFLDGI